MTPPSQLRRVASDGNDSEHSLRLPFLRWMTLVAWALLLLGFWLLVRSADAGPLELLSASVRELVRSPWAPILLLGLYGLRPLLLVPITVLNLTSGLVLGPGPGIALALTGTLVSATSGYGIGRLLGSTELAERLSDRWRFVKMLRERSFEAVVGGGLMYLHADMVNLPAGMLRIRYPLFLAGVAVGNSLTMSMAVLTGSALEGSFREARIAVDIRYVAAAAVLFLVSLLLARILRARFRAKERASRSPLSEE